VFRKMILHAVIRSAMYFEKSSWELYRSLFEKAGDSQHRELFERLAHDEQQHMVHLEQILRGDRTELPADMEAIKDDLANMEIPGPVDIPTDGDFCKILESVIAFEEMTVKFYELAMSRTPIRAAKDAFAFLASCETEHVNELKAEYKDHCKTS